MNFAYLNLMYNKRLKCSSHLLYDRTLFWLIISLISIGFIMVTSASMPISMKLLNDPFYFAKRTALYLGLIFLLSLFILYIPINFWLRYSSIMLFITIVMLLSVIIIGTSINGAKRWIVFGFFNIQPSELSKLTLFCYLAKYLENKMEEFINNFWGFLKPISVMIILTILLLMQPDFGTIMILFVTTLAILFIAGAKIWRFIFAVIFCILIMLLLIFVKPYRIQRIQSFCDPWKDPFGNGYQLTNSLMAFGRGNFFGQGLGNSIQKMEYLPEAHTDFIFAILGEELGYLGTVLVLILIFSISFRAIDIGHKALMINHQFSGFLACSIGIWFSFQTLINAGATIGLLPIKGLTMPLISYGGSSLTIMLIAAILLIRIDFETRLSKIQVF